MNNLFKKIINFFKKADYNKGFAQVNQPCFTKDGKFIGWFSRSMATALYLFCNDKNGVLHVLASERGKGAADFNGYWNCTCGYLDFGETTKQCALRELKEETGVEVTNIRYYKSQPWGMAQDMLVGFYCDAVGDGAIHMDEGELKYAEWVKREDIELQPNNLSLTNEMMRVFKEGK